MSSSSFEKSHPLVWNAVSQNGSVSSPMMHALLCRFSPQQAANLTRGGRVLFTLIDQNKDAIELFLKTENPLPASEFLAPNPVIASEPIASFENDTCEDSLQAESLERLISIINTSFKTDAGRVMLETDLASFYEGEPILEWIARMKEEWSSRIHSTVFDLFCESLELWVLSAPK